MAFRYHWLQKGDVNAFFGLMLDNVAVMIILFTLISSSNPVEDHRFTPEFVLNRMIPGTALGVLIGDLVYTWMAFRLARRLQRSDVTAMPLGLDTPSTFGVALLILLPTLDEQLRKGVPHEQAMEFAWHVGAIMLVVIGFFKIICAPLGNLVRRLVPRAGLLGSLAAIALALIAFVPLWLDVAGMPLVGFLSLTVVLVTLVAHRSFPGRIPGALAAVIIGVAAYQICNYLGPALGVHLIPEHPPMPSVAWEAPHLFVGFDVAATFETCLAKLPIALPFALATVVGGIDCTESAAAAGDEYDTRAVLLTEGVASLIAGLCGGVIQNTPYIGHPAYKSMGGRAGYTVATALFIGAAGYFGLFTHLFDWLPKAAMFPILIYVGLEITAQSFKATPTQHYPALAFAALPALAYLALLPLDMAGGISVAAPHSIYAVQTLYCLANGFIVTSLLWGAALAALIDGLFRRAALYLYFAGALALFGIIHSPFERTVIDLPTNVVARLEAMRNDTVRSAALLQTPYHWAGSYALCASLLLILAALGGSTKESPKPSNELPDDGRHEPPANR